MSPPQVHGRLTAWAEAWPLAYEDAYRQNLSVLTQSDAPEHTGARRATDKLAVALEDYLRTRAGGMSFNQLRPLRERAWFGSDEDDLRATSTGVIPLVDYSMTLARRYVEWAGAAIHLKSGDHMNRRAARYRWLTLLLPDDFLVAALSANVACEPQSDAVRITTPLLQDLLRDGVAETHLHVGAGLRFGVLWSGLMRALADSPPAPRALEKSGPAPFNSGALFLKRLTAAAIARLLCASFLWSREQASLPPRFDDFLHHTLPRLAASTGPSFGESARLAQLGAALSELDGGSSAVETTPLLHLYRGLLSAPRSPADHSLASVLRRDPLADWLGYVPERALPETRFLYRALLYLAHEGRRDTTFARCFWQYVRVRHITYRHLVQEPGTSGLDWFKRHYDRISALRGAIDGGIFESALEVDSFGASLVALEARTAPPPSWVESWGTLRSFARQTISYRERHRSLHRGPEVGLIYHFLKARAASKTGIPHEDPRSSLFGFRFASWYLHNLRSALAIKALLQKAPASLLLLRAVDIAAVELAVPAWAALPLFQVARDASCDAAHQLNITNPSWKVEPLRATYHVGEDYRRLIQGLRSIHETIAFGILHQGDRIGHGVALGESPERWVERNRVVVQYAEERLDDLLWEMSLYREGAIAVDGSRTEHVRGEIEELAARIYGEGKPSMDELLAARRQRFDPIALDILGFPSRATRKAPDRLSCLFRYLTDVGVYQRGKDTIEVRTSDAELAVLHAAQAYLRRLVGRMEITIETNPTSNLLIGDFADITEHPIFRLSPLRDGLAEEGRVLVSVNTDDPITFATCLANEYAQLYFAMLRRGVTSEETLRFLTHVRKNGLRSRFTLAVSRNKAALRAVHGPLLRS